MWTSECSMQLHTDTNKKRQAPACSRESAECCAACGLGAPRRANGPVIDVEQASIGAIRLSRAHPPACGRKRNGLEAS